MTTAFHQTSPPVAAGHRSSDLSTASSGADSASTSTGKGQDQDNNDASAQGDEEDGDVDKTAAEPAANTPSIARRNSDARFKTTPMVNKSGELLAGLQLDSARPKDSTEGSMSRAIQDKISELEASGWRPDEDMASLDDDDDYGGVDLISETSEEDRDLQIEEEKAMFLGKQMSLEDQTNLARRLSLDMGVTTDMDMSILDDLAFEPTDVPSFTSLLSQDFNMSLDKADEDIFSPASAHSPFQHNESQRRVRFEDELDGSDIGSTDTEQVAEEFPDLFMEAHQLGPNYQKMAEDDTFLDDGSDTGSCWDFEGDDMRIDLEDEDDEDSSESAAASSGYDSDEGETTDEEAPPPPSSIRRTTERRASGTDVEDNSAATPKAAKLKTSSVKRKSGARRTSSPKLPTAGTFMLDPRRPVLLVNGYGSAQRNTIYPAKIRTPAEKRFWQRLRNMYRSQTTSPRTSVQLTPNDENDLDFAVDSFVGDESQNAFFDLLGSLRPDQIVGPPEAFMPFTNIDASGNVTEDQTLQSVSDDEDKDLLALINFDSESEEDEEIPDESDSTETPWKTSNNFPHISSKTPSRRPSSQGDDLLAHLDRNRGLVGSFRRNQHYAKHIGSLASHPGVRASASEMNAIQAGRRSAGNTPITPLRKKRASRDVGARNSPITSPIPGSKKKGPLKGGFGGRR